MDLRVARRYAQALLAAAQTQQSTAEVEQDLDAIARILEAKPEFREVIESPTVPRNKKLELIDKVFSDRARPITMRFLRLLVQKRREDSIFLVRNEFVLLREASQGILRIEIVSAVPLGQSEADGIVQRIAQQTGKRIIPELSVDPSLVGGVTVRYGNSMLDGSVSGALKRLRERLYIDVLKQA
jgi:F-type H+-transporting ATPase subunit delta